MLNQPRKIRLRSGMTVSEFAAAIGVSPRTVEGWEQGRNPSRLAQIRIQEIRRKMQNQQSKQ